MLKFSVLVLGFTAAHSYNCKEITDQKFLCQTRSVQVASIKVLATNLWQMCISKVHKRWRQNLYICLSGLLVCESKSWLQIIEILSINESGFLTRESRLSFWSDCIVSAEINKYIKSSKQLKHVQSYQQLKKKVCWRERKTFVSLFCMWKQTSNNNQGHYYLESWQSFTRSSWLGSMNEHCWHLLLVLMGSADQKTGWKKSSMVVYRYGWDLNFSSVYSV